MPRPKRQRSPTLAAQTLAAVRLLAEPRRPTDLMAALGCSRRTVERLLREIEGAGLALETERSGRAVTYHLPAGSIEAWFVLR